MEQKEIDSLLIKMKIREKMKSLQNLSYKQRRGVIDRIFKEIDDLYVQLPKKEDEELSISTLSVGEIYNMEPRKILLEYVNEPIDSPMKEVLKDFYLKSKGIKLKRKRAA